MLFNESKAYAWCLGHLGDISFRMVESIKQSLIHTSMLMTVSGSMYFFPLFSNLSHRSFDYLWMSFLVLSMHLVYAKLQNKIAFHLCSLIYWLAFFHSFLFRHELFYLLFGVFHTWSGRFMEMVQGMHAKNALPLPSLGCLTRRNPFSMVYNGHLQATVW